MKINKLLTSTIALAFLFASSQIAYTENLELISGRSLENVRILETYESYVLIVHSMGVESISLHDLPETFRKSHGISVVINSSSPPKLEKIKEETISNIDYSKFPQTAENACVIIRTGDGSGTGFVAKMEDGFYLITNQHVIQGSPPHRYTQVTGRDLRPLTGLIAPDRDIVAFKLEGSFNNYLEIDKSVGNLPLGARLEIYGNSLGQGLRLSHASLLRKTANEIEVSGGIVQGNSGGPIVCQRSGKVVGVSTYVEIAHEEPRNLDEFIVARTMPKIRYFGVRIDTLENLQSFELRDFLQEYNNMQNNRERLQDAMLLIIQLHNRLQHNLSSKQRNELRRSTDRHRRTIALLRESELFRGTYSKHHFDQFRAEATQYFLFNTPPNFYIFKEEYSKIDQQRNWLWRYFVRQLQNIPVR